MQCRRCHLVDSARDFIVELKFSSFITNIIDRITFSDLKKTLEIKNEVCRPGIKSQLGCVALKLQYVAEKNLFTISVLIHETAASSKR